MKPTYRPSAVVFRALGDTNRLQILHLIGAGEKTVSAIVAATGLSQPLVSHHLQQLRQSGLVRAERRGPFVYYRLTDPAILESLEAWNPVIASLSVQAVRETERMRLPRWCDPDVRTWMRRGRHGATREGKGHG